MDVKLIAEIGDAVEAAKGRKVDELVYQVMKHHKEVALVVDRIGMDKTAKLLARPRSSSARVGGSYPPYIKAALYAAEKFF